MAYKKIYYDGDLPFKQIFNEREFVKYPKKVPVPTSLDLARTLLNLGYFKEWTIKDELENNNKQDLKVLFVRSGGLGDLLLLTSALAEFKRQFSYSKIILATNTIYFCLFENNKNVDKLIDVNDVNNYTDYDLLINLNGILEDAHTNRRIKRINVYYHKIGFDNVENVKVDYFFKEGEIMQTKNKFKLPENLIAIVLRGSTPIRSWTYENIKKLIKISPEYNFVLLDHQKIYGFDNYKNVIDLQGKTTIREAVAVIKLCNAVITPDTGLMHCAGAVGTPFVALFGSIDPELRVSHYKNYEVIYLKNKISCVPCFDAPSCNGSVRCMQEITAEMVKEKLDNILKFYNARTSIVIPVYENLEITKNCLVSIKENVFSDYEIVIVNDSISDDKQLRKCLKELNFKNLVYEKNNKNLGFVKSVNKGVSLSSGDYVCILNNDVIIKEDIIKKMIDTMKRNNNNCITGASGGILRKDTARFWFNHNINKNQPVVHYIEGWCLFTTKKIWNELNGFDEIFGFGYCEDADFSFKAKQKNYQVIITEDLAIEHLGNSTTSKFLGSEKLKSLDKKNNELLFRKWSNMV